MQKSNCVAKMPDLRLGSARASPQGGRFSPTLGSRAGAQLERYAPQKTLDALPG